MKKKHTYTPTLQWTGNRGEGTSHYIAYDRSHTILVDGKLPLPCSSDPAFRGDNSKHNPEDLFVASIAACHMLWYLHLCADSGIVVIDYTDNPVGVLSEGGNEAGSITSLVLNPVVKIKQAHLAAQAASLHSEAGEKCFLANSLNFKVQYNPVVLVAE